MKYQEPPPGVHLADMTPAQQHKEHQGPGTEGLPGYVVISPGGAWHQDAKGNWTTEPESEAESWPKL